MSLPTLSVLLGNYNEGPNIKRSLQKILSQSLRPDEIIIIDDCSTDNSIEIIQEIIKDEPEIRLIQNEKNIGTCASLNRIVHEASCEFFHLVGTDDFVLPGYYEKSMNLLSQYPQAGLCSAIVQCQDIKGENLDFNPCPPYISRTDCFLPADKIFRTYMQYGSWYKGAATIWRREPYLELGGLAPAELESLTDTFKFFQLALKYGVCFIPEILHTCTVSMSSYSGRNRLNPDHNLELIQRAEQVMVNQSDGLFPSEFVKEFKRRGLIAVANITIEKSHSEMMRALDYNENNRPGISAWDRAFMALLKRIYKMQHFFTMLHFNFNLIRFLRKWQWKLTFTLNKLFKKNPE